MNPDDCLKHPGRSFYMRSVDYGHFWNICIIEARMSSRKDNYILRTTNVLFTALLRKLGGNYLPSDLAKGGSNM